MHTSSSAYRTCRASRSASECTATVCNPISLHARMTRRAISPRLAMRTLEIMKKLSVVGCELSGGDNREPTNDNAPKGASNPHGEQLLTVFHRLSVLRIDLDDFTVDVGFDFVHQLHRFDDAKDLPLADVIADGDKRLGLRIRRAVERSD